MQSNPTMGGVQGSFPDELQLAINKAKTVSWRMGVAWTLVSKTSKISTCNGNLFNQHVHCLVDDLKKYQEATKLYISYCPKKTDFNSNNLIEAVRLSKLVELHVFVQDLARKELSELTRQVAVPVIPWRYRQMLPTQAAGIGWVRATRKPWVHIVCSNSLGGGAFPLEKMSQQLGVMPYVALKGIESSLLYVQGDNSASFGAQLKIADPQFVKHRRTIVRYLNNLSAATVSLVTIVCDPSWLAMMVQMSLANEVSYFLSLRSTIASSSDPNSIVEFPIHDGWTINSSKVMGDFMQVTLQKNDRQKFGKNPTQTLSKKHRVKRHDS